MSDELTEAALMISAQLIHLDSERRRIGREGLEILKRLGPDTATLASDLWDGHEDHMVDWFTSPVQSLRWQTPWQRIAEGRCEDVHKILMKIAHGIPS